LRAPEILPKTAVAPAKLNITAIQLKENNIKANKLAELPEELNCRNGSETAISILNQINRFFILPLWNTAMKTFGWYTAGKVVYHPRAISKDLYSTYSNTKTKRCNQKMNANVKDFEAELLAQAEDALRRTTQLSPEAEVVTATAL
jgi:hypothetical protein